MKKKEKTRRAKKRKVVLQRWFIPADVSHWVKCRSDLPTFSSKRTAQTWNDVGARVRVTYEWIEPAKGRKR